MEGSDLWLWCIDPSCVSVPSPSWTALHQHTVLTPSCLPQVHHPSAISPSVMAAASQTPPDSCICSVHLHPHITHSSTLASATTTASGTPADPNTRISKNTYGSTQPLTLFLACVLLTAVYSQSYIRLHPSQTNTPSSLRSTRSTLPIWQCCSGDNMCPLAGSWHAEVI